MNSFPEQPASLTRRQFFGCTSFAFLASSSSGPSAAPKPSAAKSPKPALIEVTDVRAVAVAGEGEHCGFPTLVRWKGDLWLSYRRATGHVGKGHSHILRSADGNTWTEAHKIGIGPDVRNCQFIATPNRLFAYVGVTTNTRATDYQTYVTFTDDGKTWSQPEKCLEPHFNLWKPFEHKGKFWANSHLKADSSADGPKRLSRLITSADGIKWEEVSVVRRGNWESETTFIFGEKDHLYALLRQKYGTMTGFILESDPPYKTWTEQKSGLHFSGHSTTVIKGVRYVFSRQYSEQSRTCAVAYIWNHGKLTPYARTPLNPPKGDCAYAEAVDMEGDILLAFYSSHEGKTNVYTARMPHYAGGAE